MLTIKQYGKAIATIEKELFDLLNTDNFDSISDYLRGLLMIGDDVIDLYFESIKACKFYGLHVGNVGSINVFVW